MPEPNDSPPPEEEKRKEEKVFGNGAVTQSQVENSANPSLSEYTYYDHTRYEDSPSNEERMDTSNDNVEPFPNDNNIGTDDNNKPTENTENKGMLGKVYYLTFKFRINSVMNYTIVIFRICSFGRNLGS